MRRALPAVVLPAAVLLAIVLVALSACSQAGASRTEAILRARQSATDPLELWSVEVVPAQAGWAPATVCTNQAIRAGFARPLPAVGERQCDLLETDAHETADLYTVRCDLGGRRLGVSASIRGDRTRDFTTHYAVTDIDGFRNPATRGGSEFEQTRRYRRLGACPPAGSSPTAPTVAACGCAKSWSPTTAGRGV